MGRVVTMASLALISGSLLARARPAEAGEAAPAGTIAFASLAPRGWDLYRLEIEAGETRRVTRHDALDFNASFAPDGNRIVNVVVLWMSRQTSHGGAIGIYGLGGDIHAQLKLRGASFHEFETAA